jgi:hypothetical protein
LRCRTATNLVPQAYRLVFLLYINCRSPLYRLSISVSTIVY